mmetsp:Transcript_16076/g.35006  ORF Transcript_16076/g.35006 Transcript_16076/m.35006 type:complete len:244 (+) Transcript_16076:1057-1788(+)
MSVTPPHESPNSAERLWWLVVSWSPRSALRSNAARSRAAERTSSRSEANFLTSSLVMDCPSKEVLTPFRKADELLWYRLDRSFSDSSVSASFRERPESFLHTSSMLAQLCFAFVRTAAKPAWVAGGGSFSASSMGLTADASAAVAPRQANRPRDSDFSASHPGGFQSLGITVLPLSSVALNSASLVLFTDWSRSAKEERRGERTPSDLSRRSCSLRAKSRSATECAATDPRSADVSCDKSSGH